MTSSWQAAAPVEDDMTQAAWKVHNPYLQAVNWRRETLGVNKRAWGDSSG